MVEPDPPRGTPTILWLMLGLGTIVAFAAVVMLLSGRGGPPRAVGPPPGASEAH
jgi:hypothetical protein